jgi:hypothetical protein
MCNKICKNCKQTLPLTSFWKYKKPNTRFSINKELIYYHTCKECCLKKIDPYDIKTVLPLLEEMNIPYYKEIYNQYINQSNPIGRYLSRMRLGNLYDLEYKDTPFVNGGIEEDV